MRTQHLRSSRLDLDGGGDASKESNVHPALCPAEHTLTNTLAKLPPYRLSTTRACVSVPNNAPLGSTHTMSCPWRARNVCHAQVALLRRGRRLRHLCLLQPPPQLTP